MLRHVPIAVVVLFWAAPHSLAQGGFDLSRLREMDGPPARTAAESIAIGVGFLHEEASNPSPERTGLGGGSIDTGYILRQSARALPFPGARDPKVLRDYRDHEPKGIVRDCLTIALGETGAQDTLKDVLRIVSSERLDSLRCEAIVVLSHLNLPPRRGDSPARIRPGETWKPLSASDDAAVEAVLLAELEDPARSSAPGAQDDSYTWYPNQEEAARGLRWRGLVPRHSRSRDMVTGWRVLTRGGALIRSTKLKAPYHHRYEDQVWD